MSDNWIVQNLNSALNTWNEKLSEIWTLLTQSPESFKGGDIWSVITGINGALTAIGYGLLVLFFAAGIVKTCGSFTDMKKPEHALKAFIRFALAQGAIMYGMELMTALFSIVQGIVSTIMAQSGMTNGGVTELPAEIVEKIEAVGMLESIPLWIVTLLGSLLITVLSFIMILTVYVLLLMAFAGIVLVGGCVVIQSIFRISIIDKIKSYGQLRTVGATKKQIMRIVKKEGHSLGWKGMSIGILLGLGVTLLLFPKGFSLSGYLLVIGCTVLICWTMICLSIRKPVKLAADISPVEAVRFTSLQKKIKNRAKRKKISPCSLGMLNFRRDWKKTVSIVFSLSLGGILLLAVSSLLLLQSPEKMARQHFKNGDYKIYMDSDKEHIDILKQGNPLNEELKQEILGIDGVEEILVTRKSAGYEATFHGLTARGTCDMITNENKELLAQAVVEGSMPGDNSILLKDDYRDFDGKEKLGETIELSLGEKTIPVTISGFFDGKKTDFASGHGPIGVDGPMMFLSEELFQELIPDVTNFDYSWDIVCDPEKSEKVGKALENLIVSHTDIGLDTFEDKVDSYGYMDVAYGVMQVISWFIFLFGVINLINITLSNQYSRRQENSVLRSIGLAPKQLAQMTVWEGMGYVVSSILLMLAIGLPITLLVWRKFSIIAYAGQILPYEFPWLQMGVYVVVLVTVELILSVWTIRRQKKQSLIEQMRAME